ncbi:MAG TPA: PA14 domain-containing protein, partial [Pontiella sp.]|nr:PA14 domain-containing protein [Pontiella sp.]
MEKSDLNLKPLKVVRGIAGRFLLASMIGGCLVPAGRSAPLPSDTPSEIVTRLAELSRLAKENRTLKISLSIEGTVYWSGKAEGQMIFSDDTSILNLELNLPCQMPDAGDRLLLEGDCLVAQAGDVIRLSGVPVVDHDGTHGLDEEASGTIFLKDGRHPIRVAWFNRTGGFGLDIQVKGPGMPRQRVPDDLLFPIQTAAAANRVNGLNYHCYEGRAWTRLPNVDHMTAVASGAVDNFDIAVRSRDNHVGLLFSGFIAIPKDGNYTFYVRSDDGSRLFIGDSSLRIHELGHETFPETRSALAEEPVDEPEYKWTEVEGAVTAFYRSRDGLEVEVMTKRGLVKVNIAEDSGRSYTLMPQNRIRVSGWARRIRTVDRGWIHGELFVQQWEDVEQLYIAPNIWTDYPLIDIGKLATMESANLLGAVVHLKGRVVSQGPGKPVLLEDESGSMVLGEAVPEACVGQITEMLGKVARRESELVL